MRILSKLFLVSVFILTACTTEKVSREGVEYGQIQNPSAEITDGSVVKGWTSDPRARTAIHFYDNVAQTGTKSLFIQADRFTSGRWTTKVLLKPWSKYRFTGWIKTENLVSQTGKGAGFRMERLDVELKGFTGTNDWTRVDYEFETGNDDCVTIACVLDIERNAKGRVWFDNMNMELISSEKFETQVAVNTANKSEPMPVYIYGQFIEHLGRCIYGGVWAEMIEDRKFWYMPGTRESVWRISGERELFSMETRDPLTGVQTPVLSSEKGNKAILSQENLGLKGNMDYNGRIILKATNGIEKALVTLKWDDKTEIAEISGLTNKYVSYPLKFRSALLVHDAVLSIEPVGEGKTVGRNHITYAFGQY